jgi:hypothetical protein
MARLASVGDPMTDIHESALQTLRDVLGFTDTDETVTMLCATVRISRLQKDVDTLKAEIEEMKPYMDRDNTP